MVAAIAEGYPQREIADAAYRYQREFDAGERGIVGVNAYADATEATGDPAPGGPARRRCERHLARLERTRRERDAERGRGGPGAACATRPRRPGLDRDEPHARTSSAAPPPTPRSGEQCGVLREVFGEYREPVAV